MKKEEYKKIVNKGLWATALLTLFLPFVLFVILLGELGFFVGVSVIIWGVIMIFIDKYMCERE